MRARDQHLVGAPPEMHVPPPPTPRTARDASACAASSACGAATSVSLACGAHAPQAPARGQRGQAVHACGPPIHSPPLCLRLLLARRRRPAPRHPPATVVQRWQGAHAVRLRGDCWPAWWPPTSLVALPRPARPRPPGPRPPHPGAPPAAVRALRGPCAGPERKAVEPKRLRDTWGQKPAAGQHTHLRARLTRRPQPRRRGATAAGLQLHVPEPGTPCHALRCPPATPRGWCCADGWLLAGAQAGKEMAPSVASRGAGAASGLQQAALHAVCRGAAGAWRHAHTATGPCACARAGARTVVCVARACVCASPQPFTVHNTAPACMPRA